MKACDFGIFSRKVVVAIVKLAKRIMVVVVAVTIRFLLTPVLDNGTLVQNFVDWDGVSIITLLVRDLSLLEWQYIGIGKIIVVFVFVSDFVWRFNSYNTSNVYIQTVSIA